jgi:hypothetical protein
MPFSCGGQLNLIFGLNNARLCIDIILSFEDDSQLLIDFVGYICSFVVTNESLSKVKAHSLNR